jgi:Tfp pilus assembly protein PilN
MARNRDPLSLAPNWHLDLRLEAELPEDNVVRTRFVVGAIFGTVAVASLLLLAWVGYTRANLRAEIADWDRIAEESKGNVREVEQMQKEFDAGALKIDKAAKIIKGRFLYSEFVVNIAQTLPATMVLDQIQLTEEGLKVTGRVASASDLGKYVSVLRQNPKFTSVFTEIKQSGFVPSKSGTAFVYDITFRLKPNP